jgi:EAL domain-containing protein (putative c-di-GMP-specific phosphodiesterase class I)
VSGIFAILTDITRSEDADGVPHEGRASATPDMGARLLSALARDDFTLYWQAIVPLGAGAAHTPFHEVLLRMKEEEESHLPPGTFLPWAEEFGLLHEIDRWVVRHVVDFAADTQGGTDGAYMVNLSAPTLLDPGFVPIVRERLEARGVPGRVLCFEFTEIQVLSNPAAYRAFVASLKGTGCRFAVSGFGRNPLSLRLLSQLGADFLKLEGGIVLSVAQNPPELARMKAMNNAARAAGMAIIAECVEDEVTRAALQRIGIDFAQGFGIAQPSPMGSPDGLGAEAGNVHEFTKRAASA